jgi:hypothetical protein
MVAKGAMHVTDLPDRDHVTVYFIKAAMVQLRTDESIQ